MDSPWKMSYKWTLEISSSMYPRSTFLKPQNPDPSRIFKDWTPKSPSLVIGIPIWKMGRSVCTYEPDGVRVRQCRFLVILGYHKAASRLGFRREVAMLTHLSKVRIEFDAPNKKISSALEFLALCKFTESAKLKP